MLMYRVLVFTKISANISFLNGPWHTSLVGLEPTSNELLLFGKRGSGAYLLGNHFLNFLVECICFLLLLFLLSKQIFLLFLE